MTEKMNNINTIPNNNNNVISLKTLRNRRKRQRRQRRVRNMVTRINRLQNMITKAPNNKPMNQAIMRQRRALNVASNGAFNKRWYVDRLTATSARVSGADLVYALPESLISNSTTNVIAVIPANPAYWLGTRVASFAATFEKYRPVKFNVHYVPQCAMTQQGNVVGGTIWSTPPATNSLQQTLRTSNGGMLTQCYAPALSHIRLSSNLEKNLFEISGTIDNNSIPFYYLALAIACVNGSNQKIVPGYFYVDYTFIFKNPVGSGNNFSNSGLATFSSQLNTMLNANISAILCERIVTEKMTLGIGTRLDVEYNEEGDDYRFLYHGSEVPSPSGVLWVFSNAPINSLTTQQMREATKIPIEYNDIQEYRDSIYLLESMAVSYILDDLSIKTIANTTDYGMTVNLDADNGQEIYISNYAGQNYGDLFEAYNGLLRFDALVDQYKLVQQGNTKKVDNCKDELKKLKIKKDEK